MSSSFDPTIPTIITTHKGFANRLGDAQQGIGQICAQPASKSPRTQITETASYTNTCFMVSLIAPLRMLNSRFDFSAQLTQGSNERRSHFLSRQDLQRRLCALLRDAFSRRQYVRDTAMNAFLQAFYKLHPRFSPNTQLDATNVFNIILSDLNVREFDQSFVIESNSGEQLSRRGQPPSNYIPIVANGSTLQECIANALVTEIPEYNHQGNRITVNKLLQFNPGQSSFVFSLQNPDQRHIIPDRLLNIPTNDGNTIRVELASITVYLPGNSVPLSDLNSTSNEGHYITYYRDRNGFWRCHDSMENEGRPDPMATNFDPRNHPEILQYGRLFTYVKDNHSMESPGSPGTPRQVGRSTSPTPDEVIEAAKWRNRRKRRKRRAVQSSSIAKPSSGEVDLRALARERVAREGGSRRSLTPPLSRDIRRRVDQGMDFLIGRTNVNPYGQENSNDVGSMEPFELEMLADAERQRRTQVFSGRGNRLGSASSLASSKGDGSLLGKRDRSPHTDEDSDSTNDGAPPPSKRRRRS